MKKRIVNIEFLDTKVDDTESCLINTALEEDEIEDLIDQIDCLRRGTDLISRGFKDEGSNLSNYLGEFIGVCPFNVNEWSQFSLGCQISPIMRFLASKRQDFEYIEPEYYCSFV